MKVFLATLLIIGLAVAAPPNNPKKTIEDMEAKLEQDIKDIQAHTQEMVKMVSDHAQEDVDAISKNPFTGMGTLIKNLSNDAKTVVGTSVTDVNKVIEHIQTALDQLNEVDAAPYLEILDALKKQLKGDAKDAQSTVHSLLKQALAHVGDDVKALLIDPSGAAKIVQENWNTDYNKFVSEGQKYVNTVQQQVQDAIDKINKQLEQ